MPIPVGSVVSAELVTPNIRPVGTMLGAFSVSLGDFVAGVVHASGANVHISKLTGWWEASPSTGTATQRPSDHGAWIDPAFYGPRVIGLEIGIDAHTWDHVTPIIDEFMAALSLDELTQLLVADDYGALTADVRQEGDPIVTRNGSRATISVSLLAPDPRRYTPDTSTAVTGLPVSSGGLTLPVTLPLVIGATFTSGRLSVVNEGNMRTRPVLAVSGPCPAFSISHLGTGHSLSSIDSVPAGRVLYLDADKRWGLLDGTALRVITGTWFDLDPGANEIQFNSPTYDAAARLSVSFRSAWR